MGQKQFLTKAVLVLAALFLTGCVAGTYPEDGYYYEPYNYEPYNYPPYSEEYFYAPFAVPSPEFREHFEGGEEEEHEHFEGGEHFERGGEGFEGGEHEEHR